MNQNNKKRGFMKDFQLSPSLKITIEFCTRLLMARDSLAAPSHGRNSSSQIPANDFPIKQIMSLEMVMAWISFRFRV
jgi:hypothetical protein